MPPLLIAATTPDARGSRRYKLKALNSISICCAAWRKTGRAAKTALTRRAKRCWAPSSTTSWLGYAASIAIPFQPAAAGRAHSPPLHQRTLPSPGHRPAAAGLGYHPLQRLVRLSQHPCPRRRPGPFMKGLAFARCTMNRGDRIACFVRFSPAGRQRGRVLHSGDLHC